MLTLTFGSVYNPQKKKILSLFYSNKSFAFMLSSGIIFLEKTVGNAINAKASIFLFSLILLLQQCLYVSAETHSLSKANF